MLRPAASKFFASAAFGFLGLTKTAMTAVFGFSSRSSWMRFGPSWLLIKVMPVILPPGRLRLATSPYWIGSLPFCEHDRNVRRRRLGGDRRDHAPCSKDCIDRTFDQLGRERRQPLVLKIRPAIFD